MYIDIPASSVVPVVRFNGDTYLKIQTASAPFRWTGAANQNFRNEYGDYIADAKIIEGTLTFDLGTAEPEYVDNKRVVTKSTGEVFAHLPVGSRPPCR